MSHRERHRATHPERYALDRIRLELGMGTQRNACPVCGDERWAEGTRGVRGHPVEQCETCGGKRVRAANLLRVIAEHASPTRGGLACETPDAQQAARCSGQVEEAVLVGWRGI